jgi:hypothetical protein
LTVSAKGIKVLGEAKRSIALNTTYKFKTQEVINPKIEVFFLAESSIAPSDINQRKTVV